MKYRIAVCLSLVLSLNACGIFYKTHHKDLLIDFHTNSLSHSGLKLNGYYFVELEQDYGENPPPFIDDYIKETGIHTIKQLSVFFFYEDGYVLNLRGINGLSRYYCAEKDHYENTYESAHRTIELMLQTQHATDKRTQRLCGFRPDDIDHKGLVRIENDQIKIQTYYIEYQSTPGAGNSAYLYELNGQLQSDTSFVIHSETRYRTNKTKAEHAIFQFRATTEKPNVDNYFKRHHHRFN